MIRSLTLLYLLFFCVSAHAYKVLFVGNSFTRYSAATLNSFAAHAPSEDIFVYRAVNGATLEDHINSPETVSQINKGRFDYVVLQGHSLQPIRHSDRFFKGLEELVKIVRDSGAEPILFETWARLQSGNYPGDQAIISAAYFNEALKLNTAVARVGDLWYEMYRNDRSIFERMFNKDGIHPTQFGTFAVAVSIYTVMYPDNQSWAPTAGVGTAGDRIRAIALALNSTREEHINPLNSSNSSQGSLAAVINLLLN